MTDRPEQTVETLYALCTDDNDQRAAEHALRYLDRKLRANAFETVDMLLRQIDVTRLVPAVALAILSMTVNASNKLHERKGFRSRVAIWLQVKLGVDRANKLLHAR
jgi:hypothetical protein